MKSQQSFTPRLVVIEGNDKGKVIPLKDGTIVIGRSKGDILIHDPRISRSHVALHYDEKKGKLSFTDLKSLNGVQHNGSSEETGTLNDGDKLQLGNTTFDCQIAREGVEATLLTKEPKLKDDSKLVPLLENKESTPVTPEEAAAVTGNIKTNRRFLNQKTRLIALGVLLLTLLIFGLTRRSSPLDLKNEIGEVRVLASQGKYEEAVNRAENLTKKFNDTSESFMILGDLYAQQGKNELALSNYRKAHDLPPALPMSHLRLIRIFLRAGLTKEAESELKHVDEIIRKDGPPSKELFIETAEIFLEFKELKQPPEKLYILAKALQNAVAPGEKIGYKLEAQSYIIQNRSQEAIEVLTNIIKMDPKDEWVYENLAFLKLSMNDVGGATSVVDSWIKLAPESTKALLVMSYLKFNDEKLAEAEPLVKRVLEILNSTTSDPHYAEGLHLLGQIYLRTNRGQEGTSLLKQACDLNFTLSCTAMNDVMGAGRNAAATTSSPTLVPSSPQKSVEPVVPPITATPDSKKKPGE